MPESPQQLHRRIAGSIRLQGPMTVAEYMGLALEEYYGSREPFGAAGDFITAPDISQMFGEMVGAWLVDLWLQTGRPAAVRLVELGPGRGTLMADIMRTLSAWPDFRSALTLHLVETSARLRDIQAAALKNYRVEWHDRFSEVPEGVCFVVANEFFDALPVHQFEKARGEWRERRIGYDVDKDGFYFTTAPAGFDMTAIMPDDFLQAPDGSVFELSPVAIGLIEEIARRIAQQGGAALIIDYGHARPGFGDTLQAVARHRYSGVLENPGEKDLTAHVDFGTLRAVAGRDAAVSGPVTQGQFLIAMGIEARARKLCENANNRQRRSITEDICRLVAPREMGRLFKVMALTPKEAIIEPAGFGACSDETSDDWSG